MGSGWRQGEYSLNGWLPTPLTDSVFSAFGEEFGFIGLSSILLVVFILLRQSLKTASLARDLFGKYVAVGIAISVVAPMLVNIAMMCGMIPITGVPLLLMSYGGSSVLFTMLSLGIIQSVHVHR